LKGLTNLSSGIYLSGAENVEIKNLTISNLMDHWAFEVWPTNDPGDRCGKGISVACDSVTNVLIHNNNLVMIGNAITLTYSGNCSDLQIYSNNIVQNSFGVFVNGGPSSTAQTYLDIWANRINDFSHWNPAGNAAASGQFHNVGIKLEGHQTCFTVCTPRIYRNHIGPIGPVLTGFVVLTPNNYQFGWSNTMVFNNIFEEDANVGQINYAIDPEVLGGVVVANNTLVNNGNGNAINVQSNAVIFNNLIYSAKGMLGFSNSFVADHNIWYYGPTNIAPQNRDFFIFKAIAYTVGDAPITNEFGISTNDYVRNFPLTWPAWTNLVFSTGRLEVEGTTNEPSISPTTFVPLTGDTVAVRKGTNLYSIGITNDFNGNPRPATGPWTIGAFEGVSTNVTATNVPVVNTITNRGTIFGRRLN
jgi:hypothetical protein